MSTEDEQQRHELAASLTDRELYMTLWYIDEVKKLNAELMDMMKIIWPDGLLTGMTLEDIQEMLKQELARRAEAKSRSA